MNQKRRQLCTGSMKSTYLSSSFAFPVISAAASIGLYIAVLLMMKGRIPFISVWICAVILSGTAAALKAADQHPLLGRISTMMLVSAACMLLLFFSQQRTAGHVQFGLPVIPEQSRTDSVLPENSEEAVSIEAAEGIISSAAVTRSPYETAVSLSLLGIRGSGEMRGVQTSADGEIAVRMRKELFTRTRLVPGSLVRCSLRKYSRGQSSPWYVQDLRGITEMQLMSVSRRQLERERSGFSSLISRRLERIRNAGRCYLLDKADQRSWESQLFITALVLGEPVSAYDPIFEDCRKSGCSYIIALSGMHVAIFLAILSLLLKKILDKRLQSLFVICFLVLYVWFVGLKPSLVRAAGMVCMSTCFRHMGRPSDSLSVLFICLAVQVLLFPQSADSVSFILSYSALTGILVFSGNCSDMLYRRIPPRMRQLLGTSLAASLTTWAYIGTVFGRISFIGIAAGIPSIALVTVIVWCSIAYIMMPCGLTADFIGKILDILANAARLFWKLCAQMPVYEMNTPEKRILIYIILVFLCMMLAVLQITAVKKRKRYDAEYRSALQLQLTEIDPGVPEYKESVADEKIRTELHD